MPQTRDIALTYHAEKRSQQRGIRADAMEALLNYGTSMMRRGGEVVFMDQASRRHARAALGRTAYAQLERALDTYLVVGDDGTIVTCAHRTRKLRFE